MKGKRWLCGGGGGVGCVVVQKKIKNMEEDKGRLVISHGFDLD